MAFLGWHQEMFTPADSLAGIYEVPVVFQYCGFQDHLRLIVRWTSLVLVDKQRRNGQMKTSV